MQFKEFMTAIQAAGIKPVHSTWADSGAGHWLVVKPEDLWRHNLERRKFPNGVVMVSIPPDFTESLGGDSIRDGSAGRAYLSSQACRDYYDPAALESAGIPLMGGF